MIFYFMSQQEESRTKITGQVNLKENEEEYGYKKPYEGKSCIWYVEDTKPHDDVDITTIKDWSNIQIPYYSWNGCGCVYFFKPASDIPGCPYVDIGMYSTDDCRMWFDTLKYESYEGNEYDIEVFAAIISSPEMQAVRTQIVKMQNNNNICDLL